MSNFSIRRGTNGVWFGTFAHFEEANIRHGVSTRLGGLSNPPYAALNLGMRTGDDTETVRLNRELFCRAVGLPPERAVTAKQVHEDKVYVVTAKDVGRGAFDYDSSIDGTDALITAEKGIPLMLFFADCVPVLVFDPVRQAVATVHAGWKGTVGKIAAKAVLAMRDNFGSNPADCLVGIGPSIGPCCYEVDRPVVEALEQAFPWWENLVVPRGDRWMLDLWETNRRQLEVVGVARSNIAVSGVCTHCNTALFYSHRAEKGTAGRLGAVISL